MTTQAQEDGERLIMPSIKNGVTAQPQGLSPALRAQEVEALAKFARSIIADYCWGYSTEPDGGDVQELAERLGLIEPHIATAEDAEGQADFGPGDTIYKFSGWLQPEPLTPTSKEGE